MSQKQKIGAAIGIVVLLVAFGFVYGQFAGSERELTTTTLMQTSGMGNDSQNKTFDTESLGDSVISTVPTPETPSAVADAILEDVAAEEKAFQDEVSGESEEIQNYATTNNSDQIYDEIQF